MRRVETQSTYLPAKLMMFLGGCGVLTGLFLVGMREYLGEMTGHPGFAGLFLVLGGGAWLVGRATKFVRND